MAEPDWRRLRERLGAPQVATSATALLAGDEGHGRPGTLRRTPAAVLIPIVGHAGGTTVVLTQRTTHLRDHAGQISLPGGRIEAGEDPVAAALREAHEEIGLEPERLEILGRLDTYATVTGFEIHPVVGWLDPPLLPRPDPFEVAEVFEVPLAFILDVANHQRGGHERDGTRREYYVLPFAGRYIWGATAGILVNFARRIGSAG